MDERAPLLDPDEGRTQQSESIFLPVTDIILYDFAGFHTFYARHHFIKHDVIDLDRPTEDIDRLLQLWLYFGLLSELLDRLIAPIDFELETEPGTYVISSHSLQPLLHEFGNRARVLGLRDHQDQFGQFAQSLHSARDWCSRIESTVKEIAPLLTTTCLAVQTLISSLALVFLPDRKEYEEFIEAKMKITPGAEARSAWPLYSAYRDRFLRTFNPCPVSSSSGSPTRSANALASSMLDNKWCPHQVKQFLNSYDYATCGYLATMKRPAHRSHLLCETSPKCVADNAQISNYPIRHTYNDCTEITAPIDQIMAIVSRGRVPLISLAESRDGQVQILVCERTTVTRYVALLHVWADGFGNPSNNALPICTLRELISWLRNLPLPRYKIGVTMASRQFDAAYTDIIKTTSWFWMDTL